MARGLRWAAAALALLLAAGAAAAAEKRALIVANQAYAEAVGPLANPHKDAALMARALEANGYRVTIERDLDRRGLLLAIGRHAAALAEAGDGATGFFYYSGHGAAEPGGRNYVIPVGVDDASSEALWVDSVPMDELRRLLADGAPNAAHLVVFDACRSELKLPRRGAGGVAEKGFKPVSDWGGMLVAYSTDPDAVASDGARGDPAGPYAQALAEELLRAKGVTASTLFGRVRFAMRRRVPGQSPWFLHGLDREVVFTARPSAIETAALSAAPRAGERFRDCPDCPEMAALPGGAFEMGSPKDESGRRRDESPQRRVSIAPFAIGVAEVSNAEWAACLADGGCEGHEPSYSGADRATYPVLNLSWVKAVAYTRWLSKKTGRRYRLPSEAEWEYAARAGTATPYWFGDALRPDLASYGPLGRTAPTRRHPANAFGLHGVHGNVSEWVADCWNGSYFNAPLDGSPWISGDCEQAVMRGGSWRDRPSDLRSAARARAHRNYDGLNVGFRVALTLGP